MGDGSQCTQRSRERLAILQNWRFLSDYPMALSSAAQTAFCPRGITEAPPSGERKTTAICLWQGLVPRHEHSPDFWASLAISVPSGCVYGSAPKPWVPVISF